MVTRIPRGELRHRVQVLSPSDDQTLDARGQRVETFEACGTRPAAFKTLQGLELLDARKLYSVATSQIEMDYWEDLTAKHRLKFKGRTFSIGHVDNVDMADVRMRVLVNEYKDSDVCQP